MFLIIMVLLLTVAVVIQGAALIYVIVLLRRKQGVMSNLFHVLYRTSKNSALLIIRHPSAESGQITSIIRRGDSQKLKILLSISAYFRHFALHVDDVVELAVYREIDEW